MDDAEERTARSFIQPNHRRTVRAYPWSDVEMLCRVCTHLNASVRLYALPFFFSVFARTTVFAEAAPGLVMMVLPLVSGDMSSPFESLEPVDEDSDSTAPSRF